MPFSSAEGTPFSFFLFFLFGKTNYLVLCFFFFNCFHSGCHFNSNVGSVCAEQFAFFFLWIFFFQKIARKSCQGFCGGIEERQKILEKFVNTVLYF